MDERLKEIEGELAGLVGASSPAVSADALLLELAFSSLLLKSLETGDTARCLALCELAFALSPAHPLLRDTYVGLVCETLTNTQLDQEVIATWHDYVASPTVVSRFKDMRMVGPKQPGYTLVQCVNTLSRRFLLAQDQRHYDMVLSLQCFVLAVLPFNEVTFQNRFCAVNEVDTGKRYPGVDPADDALFGHFWEMQGWCADPVGKTKTANAVAQLQKLVTPLVAFLKRVRGGGGGDSADLHSVAFPVTSDAFKRYVEVPANRAVVLAQVYIVCQWCLCTVDNGPLKDHVDGVESKPVAFVNGKSRVEPRHAAWLTTTRDEVLAEVARIHPNIAKVVLGVSESDYSNWLPYVLHGFGDFWSDAEARPPREIPTREPTVPKRFWLRMMNQALLKVWQSEPGPLASTPRHVDPPSGLDEVSQWRHWRYTRSRLGLLAPKLPPAVAVAAAQAARDEAHIAKLREEIETAKATLEASRSELAATVASYESSRTGRFAAPVAPAAAKQLDY